LAHELLETNKCYFLDCGAELYVWMGRTSSLQERKSASEAAEVIFVQLVSYVLSLYAYEHQVQVTLFENAEG
jgi:hypothetical protein